MGERVDTIGKPPFAVSAYGARRSRRARLSIGRTSEPAPAAALCAVTKRYEEAGVSRSIFDGLSITFPTGKTTVIRGPSGSGKTTVLNLLAGIDVPDAGAVWVSGRELGALSDDARTALRRRHIGFVFQAFNLIPTLSAAENVRLPLELNGIPLAQADRRSAHWLARVGLDGRGDAFVDRLSGGEQQRVALARALVHEPGLVLADEPTGNLDRETGERILALLDELVRGERRTLVMVTHSDDAASLADEVVWLDAAGTSRGQTARHGRPGQSSLTGPDLTGSDLTGSGLIDASAGDRDG